MVQVTIAEPQVMLFSIFSLYALSGPVLMLIRWRSAKTPAGDASSAVEPPEAVHGIDSDKESSL
jgi:hypothetical protein